jgi:hypothetical protein
MKSTRSSWSDNLSPERKKSVENATTFGDKYVDNGVLAVCCLFIVFLYSPRIFVVVSTSSSEITASARPFDHTAF